jgi:uncharacterized membrane protein SpoIIM required for sporulation
MSENGGLQAWATSRIAAWSDLGSILNRLERKRDHTVTETLRAIELYRALGRDLSIVRRTLPASRMTRALAQSYARLHAVIYRKPHNWRERLRSLFQDEIPQVVRELRGAIQLVALVFALTAGAGWWLINTYPELIGLLASEQMIDGVEGGKLWTEDIVNVAPSSVISVSILANNITVSIVAFVLGVFFGLGTFYIIAMNGFMLGGIFAFTHQHGLVELSVICIAGAAGMMLGESLIRPTHATRRESFRHAAGKTSKVLLLCALLLIVCGFIEGYVSPDPDYPMINRVVIGFGWWIVMWGALSGRLFGGGKKTSLQGEQG